jgi:flagella basal body P-ring formation protein FlgA
MKLQLAILLAAAATATAGDLDSILTPLAYAPGKAATQAAGIDSTSTGGPSVVTGQGSVQIGQKAITDALEREFAARYSVEGDLHIELNQPWTPLETRNSKDWTLSITQAPSGGLAPNSIVSFQIESGGKILGSWREGIKAKLLAPVWVATRRLERGSALDSSVCALKTVDTLAGNSAGHLPPTTDLSAYEVAQGLTEGQPLTQRDVSLRPLVRKNQLVDVLVSEGPLQISMKGIALSTAGAGEMVSVRNIDSKKDFRAQVVSLNTVQVRF